MSSKVQVRCCNCEAKIRVASRLLGEKAKCPACGWVTVLDVDSQSHQPTVVNERHASNTMSLDEQPVHGRGAEGKARQQSPSDSSRRPQMLGKYRLVRRIGRGGFGEVWEAYDTRLFRKIAIKLPVFAPKDEKQIQRFLTEGKAASRLHHPNIVSVFDAGVVGQQHFLAMGLIDGKSLNEVACKIKFDQRQCADLLCKLAQALDYAHSCGIVHRDIKPQNIVIQAAGKPQIVDFGLARILESDVRQTVEGTLLGTPAFMAPEQARGAIAEIGPHTDQYSLGALMYWLLAGRQPYEGPYASVITQVINSSPLRLKSLCAELDPRLESICQKAMSKEIEDRYDSCAQMADDLDRYLRDESVSTYRIPLATRTRRWFRRNPLEGWLSLSTAAMLVVGLIVTTTAWLRTSYLASAEAYNIAIADQKLREAKQTEHERQQELSNANEVRQKVQSGRESLESQNEAIKKETAEVERLRSENEGLTLQLEEQIATLLDKQQELTTASQRNVQLEEMKLNTELTGVSSIDSAINAILAQNWAQASSSLRSIPQVKRDGVWRVLAEAVRQRKVIPQMKRVVREEARKFEVASRGSVMMVGTLEWGVDLTGRYLRLTRSKPIGLDAHGHVRSGRVHHWMDLHSGLEVASFDFFTSWRHTVAFLPSKKRLYEYAGNGNIVYLNNDGTKARFQTQFQIFDILVGSNGQATAVARRLIADATRSGSKKQLSWDDTDIFLLSLEDGGPSVIWSFRSDVSFQRTVTLLDEQFPDANIPLALKLGRGIGIKKTMLGTSEDVMLRMVVEFPHNSSAAAPYVELEIGRKPNAQGAILLSATAATDWNVERENNVEGWGGWGSRFWSEIGPATTDAYLQRLYSAKIEDSEVRGFGRLLPGEQYVVVFGRGIVEVYLCPTSVADP